MERISGYDRRNAGGFPYYFLSYEPCPQPFQRNGKKGIPDGDPLDNSRRLRRIRDKKEAVKEVSGQIKKLLGLPVLFICIPEADWKGRFSSRLTERAICRRRNF